MLSCRTPALNPSSLSCCMPALNPSSSSTCDHAFVPYACPKPLILFHSLYFSLCSPSPPPPPPFVGSPPKMIPPKRDPFRGPPGRAPPTKWEAFPRGSPPKRGPLPHARGSHVLLDPLALSPGSPTLSHSPRQVRFFGLTISIITLSGDPQMSIRLQGQQRSTPPFPR